MGYGGDEIYSRSAWRSLQIWKELFAQTGENLFHETGVLWLAHEGDPYPVSTFETLTNLRIPVEKLTLQELSNRYPQIRPEGIGGAFLEPESGVLIARRAVQAVVREALKSGVEYLQDSIEPPNNAKRFDKLVTVSGERISAAVYVFACGPWLPKIFPDLLGGQNSSDPAGSFLLRHAGRNSVFDRRLCRRGLISKMKLMPCRTLKAAVLKSRLIDTVTAFDPDTNDRVARP